MDAVRYIKRGFEKKIVRKLKDMASFFYDKKAAEALRKKNPLIYVVYEKREGNISYSLTVMEPGRVGKEFYMTKGHCHQKSSPELIHIVEGEAVLVLQDKKGNAKKIRLQSGRIYVIPKGFAHRVVNVGKKRLSFVCAYDTTAGHDYSIVEKTGFKLIVKSILNRNF